MPKGDSKNDEQHNPQRAANRRRLDLISAAGLIILVLISAIWVGKMTATGAITTWLVFVAATITALTTGFGALPFLFTKDISKSWLGYGNALAAGLMLGASIGLLWEGTEIDGVSMPALRTAIGALIGGVLVYYIHGALEKRKENFSIGQIHGANAVKMLMIVGIMTAHSFAEGIGVGVSYGESSTFGVFITIAIAIHNIPEGLAISLILIPRGSTVRAAAGWSIFSSLPQPLMAVPAFWFVLAFKPFLPFGLGLAAGAMLWMVAKELLPEAKAELSNGKVYSLVTITALAMIAFQLVIH